MFSEVRTFSFILSEEKNILVCITVSEDMHVFVYIFLVKDVLIYILLGKDVLVYIIWRMVRPRLHFLSNV